MQDLLSHAEMGDIDRHVDFAGKAVYTLREEEAERVGGAFTRISPGMAAFMKRMIAG